MISIVCANCVQQKIKLCYMKCPDRTKSLYISLILAGILLFYVTYQTISPTNDVLKHWMFRNFSIMWKNQKSDTGVKEKSMKPKARRIKWNTQCGYRTYAVIVCIQSRLGNNMFQFASSLGIAYRNRLVTVYPYRWSEVFRMFNFTIDLHQSLPDLCKKYKTFNYTVPPIYGHAYDQHTEALGYISDHLKSNIKLKGWWENEQYFENIKDEIRKQFTFTSEIKREAEDFLQEQITVNSLSKLEYIFALLILKVHGRIEQRSIFKEPFHFIKIIM